MHTLLYTEPAAGVHAMTSDILQRVPRSAALRAVSPIRRALLPVCSQIAAAGSVRRGVSQIKSVELVCVELAAGTIRSTLFEYCFQNKINPSEFFGRFKHGTKLIDCNCLTDDGKSFKLELYLTQPRQFGWIHFIRTGPRDWNMAAMIQLNRTGHVLRDGLVIHNNTLIDCSLEQNIFDRLRIPFIKPQFRNPKTLHATLLAAGANPHFKP
ncbi:hypothetical protein KJZ99_00175 [bacterium]|nr:hypothetical protein [bacterium]